jgi:hypothetical protein
MDDPSAKLAGIGVFHFGQRNLGRPIEQLTQALDESPAPADTLLVLPEAFNIKGEYSDTDHDRTILCSLIELSKRYNIAFMAGLMEGAQAPDRFNGGYLIDSDTVALLTYKRCNDSKGGYTVKKYFEPKVYRGITLACLICADSYSDASCSNMEFHKEIKQRFTKAEDGTVLCVPAHLQTLDPREGIVNHWRQHFEVVAFANCTENQESLIYADGKYHEAANCGAKENWITTYRIR